MTKILMALVVVLVACGGGSSDPVDQYLQEYGGDRSTYERILSSDDCGLLQESFDIASANNAREEAGSALFRATLGYMTAADDALEAEGCYG